MSHIFTAEEIEQQYISALDSVNLIKNGKPENMQNNEWDLCLKRNKEHLKIMLDKGLWVNKDLTQIKNAIK